MLKTLPMRDNCVPLVSVFALLSRHSSSKVVVVAAAAAVSLFLLLSSPIVAI